MHARPLARAAAPLIAMLAAGAAHAVPLAPKTGDAYGASVVRTGPSTHARVLADAAKAAKPKGAAAVATLDCRAADGTAVLRIAHWPTAAPAVAWAREAVPKDARRAAFTPASAAGGPRSPKSLEAGQWVQWSEYLPHDPSLLARVANKVATVAQDLPKGEAGAIATREWHPAGAGPVALLALWPDPSTFDALEGRGGLADTAWSRDEHRICRVVDAR